MVFENIELPIADLPDFKTVNLNGVEKSYKKIIWLNTILIFLFFFAAPIVFLILDIKSRNSMIFLVKRFTLST